MVNKAKKQGTNYETNIVNRLNKVENFKSQRFAEGGSKDLGDIQLFADNEEYRCGGGHLVQRRQARIMGLWHQPLQSSP